MRTTARTCVLATAAALLFAASLGVAAAQGSCAAVAIRSPFAGQEVRGRVPILGSADIADFGFYKVEWAPAGEPDSWRAVSNVVNQPARHALLDTWDTTVLPDGVYRLKLTVVDLTGQEPCRRTVDRLVVVNEVYDQVSPTPTVTPTLSLLALMAGRPTAGPGEASGPPASRTAEEATAATEAPTATPAEAVRPPTRDAAGVESAAATTAAEEAATDGAAEDAAATTDAAAAQSATLAAAASADRSASAVAADAGPAPTDFAEVVATTVDRGLADQVAALPAGDEASDQGRDDQPSAGSGAPDDGSRSSTTGSSARRTLQALFSPSELLGSLGASTWPMAFAGGAGAALLLAVFVLLIVGLRGRR